MPVDLYLIGTAHDLQALGKPGADVFEKALETYADEIGAMAIAEEMSPEGLARRDATESVGKRVADKKSLGHVYCDLGRAERHQHGIPAREEVELRGQRLGQTRQEIDQQLQVLIEDPRERHWLRRIGAFGRWPVLFVCGADHVVGFAAKVRASGRSVEILATDWKP